MAELKSCPFCGGQLKELSEDFSFDAPNHLCEVKALCGQCGMSFRKVVRCFGYEKGISFDVWNTRTPQKEVVEK